MFKYIKLIFFLFIFSLIFENTKAKVYRIGDKISEEIEFYKKYKFELPSGTWTVADRFRYSYYGATAKGYHLLRIKDKKAVEGFSIAELDIGARFQSAFNDALHLIMFKNEYDGCYERPEYYILKYFTKGSSHNCFWVMHLDVLKELNDPDDPELRGTNAQYKAWIRDNKIELPKIAIGSSHSYFSRLTGGKWFVIDNYFDPQILGAPKSDFINEERSEYHKYNISNYPDHKKIMEKVVSIGAKRHKKFELEVRAKEHHKLDLSLLITKPTENNVMEKSKDIITQLNKLNNLFNSGALTEEEFKRAKEQILN